MVRKILLFIVALVCSSHIQAQIYSSDELFKEANAGNKDAQYTLAKAYEDGFYGLSKNDALAISWYTKAANNGHSRAAFLLGMRYVTSDPKVGLEWLEKSGRSGDLQAMTNLGYLYSGRQTFSGSTLPPDFAKSLYWYEMAVSNGDTYSYGYIGWYYYEGQGTARNYAKAVENFSKGAKYNRTDCINGLAYCYAYGNGVTRDLTKALELIDININKEPHVPNWYDSKGEFYLLMADRANAVIMRDMVLALDPKFAEHKSKLFTSLDNNLSFFDASKPPILLIDNASIRFRDSSGNNAIDANENCFVEFVLQNIGKGDGYDCVVLTTLSGSIRGINMENITIPNIMAGESKTISVPLISDVNTEAGKIEISVCVNEPNGFGTDPFSINVNTREFEEPLLRITDYALTGTTGTLQKKIPFSLQLLLQNVEYGNAENVTVSINVPNNVFIIEGEQSQEFDSIEPGKVHSLEYSMIANNNYTGTSIPIQVNIKEKYGKYAENRTIDLAFNQVFASNKISVDEISSGPRKNIEIASLLSEVDRNIPETGLINNNTFAIIIANENYQNDANVDFALNDGRIFKEYCLKTLGIPESNIKLSPDATLNNLRNNISWIKDVASVYKGEAEIIFYYAGHGVPDDSSKEAFLLPVDGDGRLASQTGYSLKQLYSDLASCNTKSTLVFMDACFSGAQRNGQMLASARGVVIKAKDDAPQGNMVVFSAASAEQTAHQFADKQHGMFTYFLLKKLQETNGNVTLGELGNYIIDNVSKESIVRNSKLQTPTVTPSSVIGDWTNMKL